MTISFAHRAKNGLRFITTQLNDGSTVEILRGKNSVECYNIAGDTIRGARGARGPEAFVQNEHNQIINLLESYLPDGVHKCDLLG